MGIGVAVAVGMEIEIDDTKFKIEFDDTGLFCMVEAYVKGDFLGRKNFRTIDAFWAYLKEGIDNFWRDMEQYNFEADLDGFD